MEPLELDTAIEELETRVERLRSLYEQYFMGIEKIPPAVVHKDVERRIYALRREQIRNTAKRFRLQTTIQRYNTFQQYWQRILREIENGTYKRHVLRAERSVGTTDVEKPTPNQPSQFEAAPESESMAAARARKSISPSAPRHSVPSSPRQSTLPPSEKVEAFTRALERDLAAALDGDLDFGGLGSKVDDQFDLDARPPAARVESPVEVAKPRQNPEKAKQRPIGLLPDVRKLPPKPASQTARIAPTPNESPSPQPRSASQSAATITAERVKQIHKDLIEAKARTAEPEQISLNALARKLEATAKTLSEKHAGKRVDFAVVIKDGKAIVKPIVR